MNTIKDFKKRNIATGLLIILMTTLLLGFPQEGWAKGHGHSHSHGRSHPHGHSRTVMPPVQLLPHSHQSATSPKLQTYVFEEGTQIKAIIGTGISNKIKIQDKNIREVIGQGFTYEIDRDWLNNHILITPTGVSGGKINLTLVANDGKNYDVTLMIEGNLSRSILILTPPDI